jgi:anaerobic ribonucleoside-triphosphate reductase
MENIYVKKRDGQVVPFDHEKIKKAVLSAFIDVDGKVSDYAEEKAKNISDYIYGAAVGAPESLTIDSIQKMVEKGLMSGKRKDVATAYIEYRHDRDKERIWNHKMMVTAGEKLAGDNIENQNANVD